MSSGAPGSGAGQRLPYFFGAHTHTGAWEVAAAQPQSTLLPNQDGDLGGAPTFQGYAASEGFQPSPGSAGKAGRGRRTAARPGARHTPTSGGKHGVLAMGDGHASLTPSAGAFVGTLPTPDTPGTPEPLDPLDQLMQMMLEGADVAELEPGTESTTTAHEAALDSDANARNVIPGNEQALPAWLVQDELLPGVGVCEGMGGGGIDSMLAALGLMEMQGQEQDQQSGYSAVEQPGGESFTRFLSVFGQDGAGDAWPEGGDDGTRDDDGAEPSAQRRARHIKAVRHRGLGAAAAASNAAASLQHQQEAGAVSDTPWPWQVMVLAPTPHDPAFLASMLVSGRMSPPAAGAVASGAGSSAVVMLHCASDEDAAAALRLDGLPLCCTMSAAAPAPAPAPTPESIIPPSQGAGQGQQAAAAEAVLVSWKPLVVRLHSTPQGAAGSKDAESLLQAVAGLGLSSPGASPIKKVMDAGPSLRRVLMRCLPGQIGTEQLCVWLGPGASVALLPGCYEAPRQRVFIITCRSRAAYTAVLKWHGVSLPHKRQDALGLPIPRADGPESWEEVQVEEDVGMAGGGGGAKGAAIRGLLAFRDSLTGPDGPAVRKKVMQQLQAAQRQATARNAVHDAFALSAAGIGMDHPGMWDDEPPEPSAPTTTPDAARDSSAAPGAPPNSSGAGGGAESDAMLGERSSGGASTSHAGAGLHMPQQPAVAAAAAAAAGGGGAGHGVALTASASGRHHPQQLSAVPARRKVRSHTARERASQGAAAAAAAAGGGGLGLGARADDGCPCCPPMPSAFLTNNTHAQQQQVHASDMALADLAALLPELQALLDDGGPGGEGGAGLGQLDLMDLMEAASSLGYQREGETEEEEDEVAPFFRRSRKRFPVRFPGAQGHGPEDVSDDEAAATAAADAGGATAGADAGGDAADADDGGGADADAGGAVTGEDGDAAGHGSRGPGDAAHDAPVQQ